MLILEQIRCPKCRRRLVDLDGHAQIVCPKCKSLVDCDTKTRKIYIIERHEKNADYPKIG